MYSLEGLIWVDNRPYGVDSQRHQGSKMLRGIANVSRHHFCKTRGGGTQVPRKTCAKYTLNMHKYALRCARCAKRALPTFFRLKNRHVHPKPPKHHNFGISTSWWVQWTQFFNNFETLVMFFSKLLTLKKMQWKFCLSHFAQKVHDHG